MLRLTFYRLCVFISILSSGLELRAELVSRWEFDGDLIDAEPSGNDGEFRGGEAPAFGAGFDGEAGGAISLDGIDDHVDFPQAGALPIAANLSFSLAFWVRGEPRAATILYSESAGGKNEPLFLIATDSQDGLRLEISLRGFNGDDLLAPSRSSRNVFDGEWHHVAWVDGKGNGKLYIDGILDLEVSRGVSKDLQFGRSSLGSTFEAGAPCCFFQGDVDSLQVFDHAISQEEVRSLLPLAACPDVGDTHCGELLVEPPAEGAGAPGVYTAIAIGSSDETADAVSYFFEAREQAGVILTFGPVEDNAAQFDLRSGTWTLSVTVDDDLICQDTADDSICVADPIEIGCPTRGDTHCGELVVDGPGDGGPGLYSFDVLGAFDDSDDDILFTFSAENGEGRELRLSPRADPFLDIELLDGRWTFRVEVDDDASCPDQAVDAICETTFFVGCPPEGDTHCDGISIESPAGGDFVPGAYSVSVLSALDESGDLILYYFRAVSDSGAIVEKGPLPVAVTELVLGEGNWMVTARVDDDELCADVASDAVCEAKIVVLPGPPALVAHWPLDANLVDMSGNANDGVLIGGAVEQYTTGFDGTDRGALLFAVPDGEELACVDLSLNAGLPAYIHRSFSIALWVRGDPQVSRFFYTEGSTQSGAPLLALGADVSGKLRGLIRGATGPAVLDALSDGSVLDSTWHHVTWVDDGGDVSLYIDGIRDASDFSYARPALRLDRSNIGCTSFPEIRGQFIGAIDDVRIYNHAISSEDVGNLIPEPPECPAAGDTHCGDLIVTPLSASRYRLEVADAADDSGDDILFTFVALSDGGERLQTGPQFANFTEMDLDAATWTITAQVDDDVNCRDSAEDAVCEETLVVKAEEPVLISRWTFDATLEDSGSLGNDGSFQGGDAPQFADDRRGDPDGALRLDGVDDLVVVNHVDGLPASSRRDFSVALWVRGTSQDTTRVFSETSSEDELAVFSIGPDRRANSGRVEVVILGAGGRSLLPRGLSELEAFDGAWHHLVWVDRDGDAALYVDGQRDSGEFAYRKEAIAFDLTSLGGSVIGGETCCHFEGSLDDVRIYNYALDEIEIAELAESGALFHRGDPTDDGAVNITDAVFVLNFLFLGGPAPSCGESADADDDGALNITDGVYLLNFLFLGGPAPVAPGPPVEPCGLDAPGSADSGCEEYSSCA